MPDGVDPDISYSEVYQQMDALIAAGATINELGVWERGGYPPSLMAKVVIWHKLSAMIEGHKQAAAAAEAKRRAKRKGRS